MTLREDVKDIEKEVNDIKETSWAMEILQDYKKVNKRMFVIIIILLIGLFTSIGYIVYLLNDIEYIDETTYTQEVNDFDTINGNVINKGDAYGEDKTDSKKD